MTADQTEQVVLVNDRGEDLIGPDGRIITLEKMAAHREGRRHRAVSVFVFSSCGQVMLQQRAAGKYHCHGLWSNTCCTHPRPYEIPADAARRRLREEMSLNCPVEEIFTFSYTADVGNGLVENEFDHVFFGYCDIAPKPDPQEAADWRWVLLADLAKNLAAFPERYAPWLRYCFPSVDDHYQRRREAAATLSTSSDPVLDYLCVDAFLQDIAGARSLGTAFELGLIDLIGRQGDLTFEELGNAIRIDTQGLALLLGLLRQNRVVEDDGGRIRLSLQFQKAMEYRDLLEAKLLFTQVAVYDFARLFTSLVAKPEEFFQRAGIFGFFGYNRCSEQTLEARTLTARWMRITTALTRYEAQVCFRHHDFSRYRRVLDVGGNSGEFMLQACRRFGYLRATVFDLPLVCELGRAHVERWPEGSRIEFVTGDARQDDFPGDYDLICFKSMLHDWPDPEAESFLAKAVRSLRPGGRLLIFERSTIADGCPPYSYAAIPLTLFFRCYRSPAWYADKLACLGLRDVRIEPIDLDMRFGLVTGSATITA